VDVVVVYTTSPICKVIGEFDVQDVISGYVSELWRRTQPKAGIDAERFFRYFEGCDIGHAIAIGKVRRYSKARNLQAAYGVRAPQSFLYL
jgi:predicted transcriptional regulator